MISKMSYKVAIFILLFLTFSAGAQQNLESNTEFFTVSEYYYPDKNGNYRRFDVSGFADKPVDDGVARTVRFLPQLEVELSKIKYINKSGKTVPVEDVTRESIAAIQIPVSFLASLPTAEQIPGVVSQLGGNPAGYYLPEPVAAHQLALPSVHNSIKEYNLRRAEQEKNTELWTYFRKHVVSMTELELSLSVGSDIYWVRKFSGTVVNLPPIEINNPTETILNRIKDGTFAVSATYNFRDTKISSIDASFEVEAIVGNYISDTQKSIQRNKSSAVKIFHLGHRRSRIKQSFNRQISEKASSQSVAKTVIVVDDADESMMDQFESIFFPSLSEKDAVREHLAGAAAAKAEGNTDLAQAHEDYAKAIAQKDALGEVSEKEAVEAAAALSSGNYAMFVAKGVRAQISDDNNKTTFTRILSSKETIDKAVDFTSVNKRSAQRSVAVNAILRPSIPKLAVLGVCGAVYFQPLNPAQLGMQFDFGYRGNYLELTCIEKNGPLNRYGINPGDGIVAIDDKKIESYAEVENIIQKLAPGTMIKLQIVRPKNKSMLKEVVERNVELASGLPAAN